MGKKGKTIKLDKDIFTKSRKALNDRLMVLKNEGHKHIGLDISEISYLDSEGIGQLAYNYVFFRELGTELYAINPGEQVTKVLERTRLCQIMRIERL